MGSNLHCSIQLPPATQLIGLYLTSRRVRKSGKLSKSGLSGNRTFSFPEAGNNWGHTIEGGNLEQLLCCLLHGGKGLSLERGTFIHECEGTSWYLDLLGKGHWAGLKIRFLKIAGCILWYGTMEIRVIKIYKIRLKYFIHLLYARHYKLQFVYS